MNIWKSTKVCSFFYGPQSFWKGNIADRVKCLRSPRKVPLWGIFFALLAMNGCLSAELKFRENTVGYLYLSGLPHPTFR